MSAKQPMISNKIFSLNATREVRFTLMPKVPRPGMVQELPSFAEKYNISELFVL